MTTNKLSLMAQLVEAMTPAERDQLAALRTPTGFTFEDVVRSGVENPDSGVGAYAGDHHSYEVFSRFFNPLIARYHKFDVENDRHVTDFDVSKVPTALLDEAGEYVISTRIRVGRNLQGYPLAPLISREQRNEIMQKVSAVLAELDGDLSGAFYQLQGMDEVTRAKLVADHFLFKMGDRFLESAGANRDWPEGRGIFHNADKTALVWVNEEDQLRIISMQQGGDVRAVFDRLARMVAFLEAKLPFAMHERFGAISSCPTNLGTAMRASVHVKLPNLTEAQIDAICGELELSRRGIHGEHSESAGGVHDISNKRRLGLSEVAAVLTMYEGVKRLIEADRAAAQAA